LTESRSRSRNAGLRLAALQRAGGVCEGCGVNFAKRHGGLGSKCLVVHHKKQLKDTDQPVETKLSDLAVVCANCHMMIHVNRDKALTLSQLKKRLGRH
jgi:5-methylcytosine-specific restriction protein A